MRMKRTAMAALAALLACAAVATAASAAQFRSKVAIRFVEVIEIQEPPIPLSEGTGEAEPGESADGMADAEPQPGDTKTTAGRHRMRHE